MTDSEDLSAQIVQARVEELEGLINQARHDYYNHTPTVTDEVYDAWVDELSELKVDSPAVTAVGAVPSPTSEWKKTPHGVTMGSLDKVNDLGGMTSWVHSATGGKLGESLLVTEKLDGISIHVKYVNGVFHQAITRGDGSIGEDITSNVIRMQGIPGRMLEAFTGSLRGEIILSKSEHAKHFPDYANPRNAASGISKRYDGKGCEHLRVIFYQVLDGKEFDTEATQFTWLANQRFFIPNWYVTAMIPGVRTPHDLWLEYQQAKRAGLDYEIDGLVVRVNDMAKQIALGEKDGRPKGAVAFKFAAMTRETVLNRIDWQVGGTGRITPVAIFRPVVVMGAEITNASLYNLKYIRDLKLDVGATILIARANDVIPRIVSVRRMTGTIAEAPSYCPVCNTGTMMDGEYVICPNTSDCPAQTVGRIKRYLKELDVKEWGDVLVEKLVDGGMVRQASDLYKLTEEQLAGIERMGDRSAQKVLKTLWDRNPIPLENLLGACSIPFCASATIKMVMGAGLDTLDKLRKAQSGDLLGVPGLGPVKAQALWKWLHSNISLVDDILSAGVKIKEKIHGNLTGKSFCFTGSSVRPRGELEGFVVAAGGEVKGSVSKKLTYLVMADPNSTSTKAQAARKNGTKVLSEEDFLKMVGE